MWVLGDDGPVAGVHVLGAGEPQLKVLVINFDALDAGVLVYRNAVLVPESEEGRQSYNGFSFFTVFLQVH